MKKLLIILGCIVLSIFTWNQYRHFYHVGNMTFTVWKKYGGYCYITPYKYWGLSVPENDYIKTSNLGQLYIYIKKDSLLIFNYPTNDGIDNHIECHLTDFDYENFTAYSGSLEEVEIWQKIINNMDSLGLPFIDIDIRHMKTKIRDSSISTH